MMSDRGTVYWTWMEEIKSYDFILMLGLLACRTLGEVVFMLKLLDTQKGFIIIIYILLRFCASYW